TRWALSYLRGPLTAPQIAQLMAGRKPAAGGGSGVTSSIAPPGPSPAASSGSSSGDGELKARMALRAREERDAAVEKLRKKFAPKLAALKEKERRAAAAIEREQSQLSQQKMQSAFSIGASVLGALLGTRRMTVGNVSRAATAARSAARIGKEGD